MDVEKELKEIKELALNNSKKLEEHTKRIDINFEKATNNSIALEILKEYKEEIKQLHNEKDRQYNILKRLCIVIVMLIVAIIVLGLHHFIG